MLTIPDHVSVIVFAALGIVMVAHAVRCAYCRVAHGVVESPAKDLRHIVLSFGVSGLLFFCSLIHLVR